MLRSCAKCSVFVAFQFTTYETIDLLVNRQLAGLYSAGNDDAESFPKALGTLLGSAGVRFWRLHAIPERRHISAAATKNRSPNCAWVWSCPYGSPAFRGSILQFFPAVWPHVWVQLRILAVTSVNPRCQRRMEHIEESNLQNMILKVHFAVE